ncbi:MAG: tol-pal system protein YbgF [Pseudomonadota bacterium]
MSFSIRYVFVFLSLGLSLGLVLGLAPRQSAAQQTAQQAGTVSSAYIVQIENRMAVFEQELQRMTGMIEQLNFQIRQLQNQLQQNTLTQPAAPTQPITGGVPQATPLTGGGRASALNQGGLAQPGTPQSPPPGATGQEGMTQDGMGMAAAPAASGGALGATQNAQEGTLGTLIVPSEGGIATGDPQMDFDTAYNLLASTDYDSAYDQFRAFIETYPEHPLVSDAYYWIGEIAVVNGNTDAAIAAFATGYRDRPDGAKSADSLFKLGTTLLTAGRNEEACRTFRAVLSVYPDGATPLRERASALAQQNNCPA